MLMVASDRVSVFDVVLPDLIPDKGRVLTALSAFWFEQTADLAAQPRRLVRPDRLPRDRRPDVDGPGHAGAADAIRCAWSASRAATCSARAWSEYQETGHGAAARRCPPGCAGRARCPSRSSRPPPRPRPATTSRSRDAEARRRSWAPTATSSCGTLTLAVYAFGAEHAAARGLILADTKLEFGAARRRAARDRRDDHPRLVALLAGRRLRGRHVAAVVRQAVRARPLPRDRMGP